MTTYGAQGEPIKIAQHEPVPQPKPVPSAPPEPDPGPAPAPTLDPADVPVDAAEAEARLAKAEKIAKDATAYVTALENKAATILVRGDYQKGARQATIDAADGLRRALGI